jgi:hypothetical protein
MSLTARRLVGAACALGLIALGLVNTAGQDVKPAPKVAPPAAVKVEAPNAALLLNAAARVAVNDEMLQPWEQHYGPAVRRLHRTELHFMRLVSRPTKQQYEKIAAETEPSVKDALRGLVAASNGAGGQSDPRAVIAAAVAKSVRANLSPEQAASYLEEIHLRTAARRRLVVLSLVAMVDKLLMLTSEQREKLQAVLTGNWNDSWDQTQLLMMGGQYLPSMPDAKIVPILSEAQKDIWRTVPKGTVRFGVNLSNLPAMDIEEEVWDEDKPPKKPDAAGGKEPPK